MNKIQNKQMKGTAMKNRIMCGTLVGLLALTLTNCGALYQNMNQSELYQTSPYSEILALAPPKINTDPVPGSNDWQQLIQIGPGYDVIVTLRDGNLRGGQIFTVDQDTLVLHSAGQKITIPRSDIALVKVKRSTGAVTGGVIGFLVTGVGLTATFCEDCPPEGWLLGVSLLGIPGGLLGALIGSSTGGDVEIVP